MEFFFGETLRKYRSRARMSQKSLARVAGFHASYICHIERGAYLPPRDTVDRLAEALKLSEEERTELHAARDHEDSEATADITIPTTVPYGAQLDGPLSRQPPRSAIRLLRLDVRVPVALVLLPIVVVVAVLAIAMVALISSGQRASISTPTSPTAHLATPDDGQYVGDSLTISVRAFPAHPGDPPIDHVVISAWWSGLTHGVTICRLNTPKHDRIYECAWNLASAHVPAGILKIAVRVYDTAGHSTLSPDPPHLVIYKRGFKPSVAIQG